MTAPASSLNPVAASFISPSPLRAARRVAALGAFVPILALAGPCDFEPVKVAENVYAFLGAPGEASVENCGRTGNQGFIVGASGIVVVDASATALLAERMLAAIAKVSAEPVLLLVNTRAAPERVLGNGAFARRGVPILAHRDAGRLMAERCQTCIKNLGVLLGADAVQGTEIVRPARNIEASTALDIGGRAIEIIYPGWGVSPDNLAVLDRASGVLFAGDLASAARIPDLRDARVETWLRGLERMARLEARVVVPGHGPVSPPAALGRLAAYLRALDSEVRKNYDAGKSLLETSRGVDLPEFRDWAMYGLLHPRNARYLYLRLEEEDFERR